MEQDREMKRFQLTAAVAGALALLGMGVGTAVIDSGTAAAMSTNSVGGAGATAVQETGENSQPATSVVISASPMVKAPPYGGGFVDPGQAVSP
jgi:hypothetical protein